MAMPVQKPGKSKQDYCTPPEFLRAVEKRLGIKQFYIDLAANKETRIVLRYLWDAFSVSWTEMLPSGEWGWLNPPYSDITPWVEKAYQEARKDAQIAMLIPASVGSNWWADFVHRRCYVLFPSPRLQFVGTTAPYPKDCALLLYGCGTIGYDTWRWK